MNWFVVGMGIGWVAGVLTVVLTFCVLVLAERKAK